MMKLLITCIFGSIFIIYKTIALEDPPLVKIDQGSLYGVYLKSRDGKIFSAFMGIPYANKPEKFELSEPASSWEGIYDASKFGSVCPQLSPFTQQFEGDEDQNCLFVNVFTPNITANYPVLVFIHGGGFQFGNSDENGPDYFMDEQVVLVTLNYRLSSLGFLSTSDEVLPGNLGLKDQLLGLKWVQNNIQHFGGDKNRVTLFGESAGAASVSHHVLSPASAGLFRSAIFQSGTALDHWALVDNPVENAKKLAKKLNCPSGSSLEIKKCLKSKSVEDIISVILLEDPLDNICIFGPTLEVPSPTAFITERPQKLLEEGRFSKIPLVITVNEEEGLLIQSASIMKNDALRKKVDENWIKMAPSLFFYDDPNVSQEAKDLISKRIRKFYFGDKPISEETFQNLTNVFSDSMFIYNSRNTAILHAKHAPVFAAVLSYRGWNWSQVLALGYTEPMGMTHADDLPFLFSCERYPKFVAKSEPELVSKLFVKTWVTFAEHGDPNMSQEQKSWPPVSAAEVESKELNWLYIKKMPAFQTEPIGKRMAFWDKVYKKLKAQSTKKDEL